MSVGSNEENIIENFVSGGAGPLHRLRPKSTGSATLIGISCFVTISIVQLMLVLDYLLNRESCDTCRFYEET